MISSIGRESSYDFEVIYLSLVDNIDYFYFTRNNNCYASDFAHLLGGLLSNLKWYETNLKELYAGCHSFDFNNIRGNGFRSFILIFERCFSECYSFSKRLCVARGSFFFRHQHYKKEIQSLLSIFEGLKPGLKYLFKMMRENESNDLLMPAKVLTAEELILECGGISQLGFYGRFGGFYYCTSMKRILQGVGVIMATFSDLYQNTGSPIARAILTIFYGIKYTLNPELRAQQIVDVAQNASVEFLKAFWSLSETQFMKQLPSWVCPKMKIREEIIVPSKSIVIQDLCSRDVVVPVPSSHIQCSPIRCLLLSAIHRSGQVLKYGNKSSNLAQKSKKLLFHCHGGGFVSQNPESHEIYLRHWAYDLDMPIISVDYTLSPEAPFPRALEEVLLTYAWVLQNPEKLGWTGDTICFAGDSAGGTILMGLVLKIMSLNIQLPKAILCAYTPLVLDLVPSPSRLFCWIDPLLPLGFMISCLDAYAGDLKSDSDEYLEDPAHVNSGRNSRKISSINDIFDSSMNFLNQSEWIEVEANEPQEYAEVFDMNNDNSCVVNMDNYIEDLTMNVACYNDNFDESTDSYVTKDYELYNFPHDMFFDFKSKCKIVVESSFKRISEAIISSSIFQKVVSPLLPENVLPYPKKDNFSSMSESTLLQKIKNLHIVSKNPFMSPLLASDDMLRKMPPIYLVTSNFDPCLDDSITLAKKLQMLNRHVTMDIIDGLPHGFLNFLPFSQEAHDGSDLCVRRLKEAMSF